MRWRHAVCGLLLSGLALGVVGCGIVAGTVVDVAEDIATYPLREWVFLGAYRIDNPWDEPWSRLPWTHDEGEVLVGLCLSGGGSRSAYFDACVLEALAKTPLPGTRKTILDEVDWISSVSGGSLAATYWCLNRRREGFPADDEAFYARMREDMAKDFEVRGFGRALCGWGFPLALTYYDRGDLIASVWDSNFLDGLTYGDLPPDGPALIVNATSYDTGQRFLFTTLPLEALQGARLFDLLQGRRLLSRGYGKSHVPFEAMTMETIDSSIARCPLSTGIVASAAVPNLIGPAVFHQPERGHQPARDVHLGDGGIYDNHGLETMVEVVARRLETGPAKRAIIIAIDGTGFFDTESVGAGDVSTVADFTDRPVTIAWLRAASFAEPAVLGTEVTSPDGARTRLEFGAVSLYDDEALRPDEGEAEEDGLLARLAGFARESTIGLVEDFNARLRAVGTRFSITDDDADAIRIATPYIVRRRLAGLPAVAPPASIAAPSTATAPATAPPPAPPGPRSSVRPSR